MPQFPNVPGVREEPPEETAARIKRQAWRTTNAAALKSFDDALFALREAVRTQQGDHTALATAAKAEIDTIVELAKEE
jgi:hypothetical protein